MNAQVEQQPRAFGGATWWHLAWLLVLLYQPLFDQRDPVRQWIGVGVIAAAFLPVYFLAQVRPRVLQVAPWVVLAEGLVATPFNAGANVLFVYAAAFVGATRPRREAMIWLVGMCIATAALGIFSTVPMPWVLFTFAPSLILIWVVGLLSVGEREGNRISRMHNAQIEHLATLSERERIARDLHDLLGQTLTGIVVRSQLAQKLARIDLEAGIKEMADVEQAARAALTEVRATVTGWRQVDIDEEFTVARDALAAAGIEVTVQRDPDLVLSPMAETALGMALREGVTNVVRHSGAEHCTVTLRQVDGKVVLEVADDGVGGNTKEGNGLTGMRERIGALGGDVDRIAGRGSALTVAVPAAVAT